MGINHHGRSVANNRVGMHDPIFYLNIRGYHKLIIWKLNLFLLEVKRDQLNPFLVDVKETSLIPCKRRQKDYCYKFSLGIQSFYSIKNLLKRKEKSTGKKNKDADVIF